MEKITDLEPKLLLPESRNGFGNHAAEIGREFNGFKIKEI